MSDGFFEFGFDSGDEGVRKGPRKFSGEKGKTYRISFVWWPGLDKDPDALLNGMKEPRQTSEGEKPPTPTFIGAKRHFMNGVGYFLNKGPEYTKIAGAPAKTQVATIIAVWPTDSKGTVDKETILKQPPTVMPWIFSRDKYDAIKAQDGQFEFANHDLMAQCTDSQYQKMNFMPAKQNLLRTLIETGKGESVISAIMDAARDVAANIRNEVAQDLTIDQIREKLGGDVSSPTGGAAPAANEEIDNILGGILEGESA